MNQYLIVSKGKESFRELSSKLMLDDPTCTVQYVKSLEELRACTMDADAEYVLIKLKKNDYAKEGAGRYSEGKYGEKKVSIPNFAKEGIKVTSHLQTNLADRDKYVEWVARYVNSHLGENLNLETLSAYLYISKNYMSSIFSHAMGMTLKDYIIRQRMEKARQLLMSSKMPIRDIAALVGYSSASYFSATFHKIFHEKPSDCRRTEKEGSTCSKTEQKRTLYPSAARQLTFP